MKIDKKTYYIAHNNDDIVHYGYVEKGDVSTGQPHFETFDNEKEYLARLKELGVEPEPEE